MHTKRGQTAGHRERRTEGEHAKQSGERAAVAVRCEFEFKKSAWGGSTGCRVYRNGVVVGTNFEFEGVCEVGTMYERVDLLRPVESEG